jgi:hypothetical protein
MVGVVPEIDGEPGWSDLFEVLPDRNDCSRTCWNGALRWRPTTRVRPCLLRVSDEAVLRPILGRYGTGPYILSILF